MADTEVDTLFVGIKEPKEIRKSLLESSKSIIQCLQKHEKLKLIREDKDKEIKRLKLIIKEIQESIIKLKSELPKTNLKAITEVDEKKALAEEEEEIEKIEEVRLRSLEKEKLRNDALIDADINSLRKQKKKVKKTKKKKSKKKEEPKEEIPPEPIIVKKPVPKEINDLEKLEAELKSIENKLSGI